MRVIDGPVAILNDAHPYLRQFPLSIAPEFGGRWRIRWEGFNSVSQEVVFKNAADAAKRCEWMNCNRHIVEANGLGDTLDYWDAMWQGRAVERELREARALVASHDLASRIRAVS